MDDKSPRSDETPGIFYVNRNLNCSKKIKILSHEIELMQIQTFLHNLRIDSFGDGGVAVDNSFLV